MKKRRLYCGVFVLERIAREERLVQRASPSQGFPITRSPYHKAAPEELSSKSCPRHPFFVSYIKEDMARPARPSAFCGTARTSALNTSRRSSTPLVRPCSAVRRDPHLLIEADSLHILLVDRPFGGRERFDVKKRFGGKRDERPPKFRRPPIEIDAIWQHARILIHAPHAGCDLRRESAIVTT